MLALFPDSAGPGVLGSSRTYLVEGMRYSTMLACNDLDSLQRISSC